jgi:sulfur-oxidizing protein SoxX
MLPLHAETMPDAVVVAADAIAGPLTNTPGDAARGRAIVLDRANGNCLICHKVPVPGEPFQGEIGPDLAGVGLRLNEGQLRLRLVDESRLNAATVMPPYYRTAGLTRVDPRYRDKPALTAAEIEDVVAYLATLKD